jgi:hypothetical protein
MVLVNWARDLAADLLARQLPQRWTHVQAVTLRAKTLDPLMGDDADLLAAAAWLHDIGYSPEIAITGLHSLDGARHLAKIDAPARLSGLVAFHSAAWWDAELCGLTSALEEFVDEDTLLKDGLWWADMTTGPDGQTMTFPERMAEVQRRLGVDHVASQGIVRSWSVRSRAIDSIETRLASVE